ncbi:hypothetical protein JCM1840_006693 [Sporobolomyces johnsonii]
MSEMVEPTPVADFGPMFDIIQDRPLFLTPKISTPGGGRSGRTGKPMRVGIRRVNGSTQPVLKSHGFGGFDT